MDTETNMLFPFLPLPRKGECSEFREMAYRYAKFNDKLGQDKEHCDSDTVESIDRLLEKFSDKK